MEEIVSEKKKSLKVKLQDGVDYVKTHWNKPPKGKYLSLKEILAYCAGGMGVHGSFALMSFVTAAYGAYLAKALNFSNTNIMIIILVTQIVTIVRSPIISMLIDNVQTKIGKFRPWLLTLAVPIALLFFMVAIIPNLIKNESARLAVFIIIFNTLLFLITIYHLAYQTLVQVISPLQEERTQLMSIGSFIYSLGPSITSMLFPLLANLLFSSLEDGKRTGDGVHKINSYIYILPVIAVIFIALGVITALGTKERTVLPKEQKQKINFFNGVKNTMRNKYFWLLNVSTALGLFKLIVTVKAVWIYTYMMKNPFAQTIFTAVLGFAFTPGMLLAPFLIKKMGKKNLVLLSNAIVALAAVPIFFVQNSYLIITCLFIITLGNSVQIVTTPAFTAQVYDYQQYKTGDRMEGFLSQFGVIILTAVTMATVFVEPKIYSTFGFDGKEEDVLYNLKVLIPILRALAGLGIGSAILAALPFFLWDLTEERHDQIMEILAVKANLAENKITQELADELVDRLEKGESGVARKLFDEMFLNEDEMSEDRKQELQEFEENLGELVKEENNENEDLAK